MYKPFNSFLFRTPYFPISYISNFEKVKHGSVFKEMLLIATPDLSESLDKGEEKARFSAYRYYQRACTRSTPFGLFAGCSVGTIGNNYSKIQLSKQEEYKRSIRLDMNYFCALIQQIENNKNVREQLRYSSNSSIYHSGNHLRYVAYHYRKSRRIHQIKQIENTEYIQKILSSAALSTSFSDLSNSLVDNEISLDESKEFIHELIDAQVLTSELMPTVTNTTPLSLLLAKLKRLPSYLCCEIIETLSEIEKLLDNINHQPIGKSLERYSSIITSIEKTKIETEIKYLFQTDLFKPVQCATVSDNVIKEIQQTLCFLNKLSPPFSNKNIKQFIENFSNRYENKEMPLLFVLDNELGISYADKISGDINPLVDDFSIPQRNSKSKSLQSLLQSLLFQKYQQSPRKKVIEITDEDVKSIDIGWDDLPPTISVLCEILQDNKQGCSFFIKTASGISATSLLGRFCHLDAQIMNNALAITEKEAELNPNVILAEIVHLPESRTGNVLLRPILRPYEIPYLAKSGVSNEFEIRLDDLYVSIRNNRIQLRSKRLNKEIIPRMSNAHNFSGQNSMPVYHFLCDMQHQDGRPGLWFNNWHDVSQNDIFLPRIVYKNCILSRARWIVHEKEMKIFIGINDDRELLLKMREWRNVRAIPDIVVLSDSDNELYVDMNNPLSIRSWLSIVKKRPYFYLEEFLFNSTTAIVHGPEGVFTNEFIFSFYKEKQ